MHLLSSQGSPGEMALEDRLDRTNRGGCGKHISPFSLPPKGKVDFEAPNLDPRELGRDPDAPKKKKIPDPRLPMALKRRRRLKRLKHRFDDAPETPKKPKNSKKRRIIFPDSDNEDEDVESIISLGSDYEDEDEETQHGPDTGIPRIDGSGIDGEEGAPASKKRKSPDDSHLQVRLENRQSDLDLEDPSTRPARASEPARIQHNDRSNIDANALDDCNAPASSLPAENQTKTSITAPEVQPFEAAANQDLGRRMLGTLSRVTFEEDSGTNHVTPQHDSKEPKEATDDAVAVTNDAQEEPDESNPESAQNCHQEPDISTLKDQEEFNMECTSEAGQEESEPNQESCQTMNQTPATFLNHCPTDEEDIASHISQAIEEDPVSNQASDHLDQEVDPLRDEAAGASALPPLVKALVQAVLLEAVAAEALAMAQEQDNAEHAGQVVQEDTMPNPRQNDPYAPSSLDLELKEVRERNFFPEGTVVGNYNDATRFFQEVMKVVRGEPGNVKNGSNNQKKRYSCTVCGGFCELEKQPGTYEELAGKWVVMESVGCKCRSHLEDNNEVLLTSSGQPICYERAADAVLNLKRQLLQQDNTIVDFRPKKPPKGVKVSFQKTFADPVHHDFKIFFKLHSGKWGVALVFKKKTEPKFYAETITKDLFEKRCQFPGG